MSPRIRLKKPWDRESQDRKKRAERLAKRRPFVYFFLCRNFLKIGWTTDPAKRLSCIQICNPDEVKIAALIRGGEREESILHRTFRPLYHRAEWFRNEGALAELISLIANEEPERAREITGEWFLQSLGKTELLFDPSRTKPVTSDNGLHLK